MHEPEHAERIDLFVVFCHLDTKKCERLDTGSNAAS